MANKTPAQAAAKAARKQKKKDIKDFRSLASQAPKAARVTSMAPDLIGTEDVLGHYAASCITPFDGSAVGARVPAPYEARTVTAKLHTLFNPKCADVAAPYSFSCVLTASPIATIISNSGDLGAINGGTNCNIQVLNANPSVLDPVTGLTGRFINVTGYDHCRGATTAANLAKLFGQYRVVSCGFRVRVESSFTNTQGRLLVARAPASSVVPLINSSYWGDGSVPNNPSDIQLLTSVYANLGFPWVGDASLATHQQAYGDIADSILSFPDSLEVSLPSILESGFEFLCPKTSAMHTQFIHAQALGEYSVGEQSVIGTNMSNYGPDVAPGQTSNIGGLATGSTIPRLSDNSVAGFTNVALKFVGLSPTTTVSIETIYHLEGTPAAYDVTDPTMPIPTSMKSARASTAHVDEVNSVTGAMPMGRPADAPHTAVEQMVGAAMSCGVSPGGRVGSALSNAAGAVLGMVPGGGMLKRGASMLNAASGGALGNALKGAVSAPIAGAVGKLKNWWSSMWK